MASPADGCQTGPADGLLNGPRRRARVCPRWPPLPAAPYPSRCEDYPEPRHTAVARATCGGTRERVTRGMVTVGGEAGLHAAEDPTPAVGVLGRSALLSGCTAGGHRPSQQPCVPSHRQTRAWSDRVYVQRPNAGASRVRSFGSTAADDTASPPGDGPLPDGASR